MSEQKPITLPVGTELHNALIRLISNGAFVLVVLAVVGLYICVTDGLSLRGVGILFGSVASFVALVRYLVLVEGKAHQQKRSFALALTAFGGFVPYCFGCYLVAYEAIWGLWKLHTGFIFSSMVSSLLYIVAGYQVVLAIYRLSEVGQAISDGRAVFKEAI